VITVPVTIADVDLNLFTGRARFGKFLIGDPAYPIARLPELSLRFSFTALLTGRIDVEQVILQNPALSFERIGPEPHSEKARATYCAADAGVYSVHYQLTVDTSLAKMEPTSINQVELMEKVAKSIAADIAGAKAGKDWWFEGWRVEGPDNDWNL
jgi:hypothetical protein